MPPAGSTQSQEALFQAIIGQAVELLSGPGGVASYLRRHLGIRPGGPSLPLDIGYSETVPASIRVLLCHFHHRVMIHRRGWTLVVNSGHLFRGRAPRFTTAAMPGQPPRCDTAVVLATAM